MKVEIIEEYESYSLGVYLDNGKEVGRYCVVENPEEEQAELDAVIRKCAQENLDKLKEWRAETLRTIGTPPDSEWQRGWYRGYQALAMMLDFKIRELEK